MCVCVYTHTKKKFTVIIFKEERKYSILHISMPFNFLIMSVY